MAFNARAGNGEYTLPAVKPRIVGGRLVTDIELPLQLQGLTRSGDKVNQHNPLEWEKQFHAAMGRNAGRNNGNSAAYPVDSSTSSTAPANPDRPVMNDVYSRLQNDAADGYLPRKPLELSETQQAALIYEIDQALQQTNPEVLKHCYIELTGFDRSLTSAVRFNDLALVLSKNNVALPNHLLRLIASLFVVPQQNGESKVNYEKLLSFLGACFRRIMENHAMPPRTDGPFQSGQTTSRRPVGDEDAAALQSPFDLGPYGMEPRFDDRMANQGGSTYRAPDNRNPQKPVYYESNNAAKPREVPVDRDISRTKRLAEEHLRLSQKAMRPQDFESLRVSFLRADRLVRRALSEAHMKEICHQHKFPLPDFVLEEIIRTCCTHRGGGQYDWEEFIDFLEKLQPLNTSLQISDNRLPVGRRPPSPVASWPHAESPIPPEMMMNDGEMDADQQQFYESPDEVLRQIRQSLFDARGSDWLRRFEHFANALYDADETHTGFLRQSEVLFNAKRLNESLRLSIPEMHMDEALRYARMADGRVNLNTYLKALTRTDSRIKAVTVARNTYR